MMEWKELEQEFNNNFSKVNQWLDFEFSKIKSGRPNPNMFNDVLVSAYGGEKTPLFQLANISAVDAFQIIIKPYDKSLLKDIAKALTESKLEVNPQINPDCIRIIFSPLTEESRKEFVKKAKILLENAKVKVRDVRQTVQAKYKKNKELSSDTIKYFEDELNKATKNANKILEDVFAKKEKSLLSL